MGSAAEGIPADTPTVPVAVVVIQPTASAAGEGQAICVDCKRALSTNDMIPFGEYWVCADCKTLFFQRVREGALAIGLRYAGFWIRSAAWMLDFVIVFVLWMLGCVCMGMTLRFLIPRRGPPTDLTFFLISTFFPLFIFLGIPTLYRTFFVGRFGATLGKMAFGLKVVRPDGTKIGGGGAFVRYFAEWISWILFFAGYIMVAFDDQKRALHDRICRTRVIRKT